MSRISNLTNPILETALKPILMALSCQHLDG